MDVRRLAVAFLPVAPPEGVLLNGSLDPRLVSPLVAAVGARLAAESFDFVIPTSPVIERPDLCSSVPELVEHQVSGSEHPFEGLPGDATVHYVFLLRLRDGVCNLLLGMKALPNVSVPGCALPPTTYDLVSIGISQAVAERVCARVGNAPGLVDYCGVLEAHFVHQELLHLHEVVDGGDLYLRIGLSGDIDLYEAITGVSVVRLHLEEPLGGPVEEPAPVWQNPSVYLRTRIFSPVDFHVFGDLQAFEYLDAPLVGDELRTGQLLCTSIDPVPEGTSVDALRKERIEFVHRFLGLRLHLDRRAGGS
jgi:hypothetical protein